MALSVTFDEHLSLAADTQNSSTSNWDALYCSHLWNNSDLRRAVINAGYTDNRVIKYCYTCKGKIRKYEIRTSNHDFVPTTHSTPNGKITNKIEKEEYTGQLPDAVFYNNLQGTSADSHNSTKDIDTDPQLNIPTISSQIDSSFRQKFSSYEMRPHELNRRRLRKSLKGIGCIINLALTDSPLKKRTQIQACSISVMIVAIVVISFILVNFTTPSFTGASGVVTSSTIVVPTESTLKSDETSSVTNSLNIIPRSINFSATRQTLSGKTIDKGNSTISSNVSSEIIKTNGKNSTDEMTSSSNIMVETTILETTNLPPTFCSCQINEVCMLETTSGKGICREALDLNDPAGCGGLCALNTEACREIDKATGVKYCMPLQGIVVPCSEEEWQCRNTRCVPAEARCNGTPQCYDKSDEMNCECDLTKNFRCGHSMSCMPNEKRCDSVVDCWDGFDEINCTAVCPDKDQFTCNNGQCIELALFCDGLADCADSSDEPQGCGGPCLSHEMHCANGRCVSKTRHCDGRDDCGDMSDEFFCPSSVTKT